MENQKFEIISSADFKEPRKADVFRVFFDDQEEIILEFGKMDDDKKKGEVIASISVPPKFLYRIVGRIIDTGCLYQGTFEEDINFPNSEEMEGVSDAEEQ